MISYEVSTDAHRFASYTSQYPLDVLKIVPSHLQALLQTAEAKQILPRKYLILGRRNSYAQLLETIQSIGRKLRSSESLRPDGDDGRFA